MATGTTYYKTNLGDILNAFMSDEHNVWIYAILDKYGYDALDIENNLFGSAIIGDDLYICKTDGEYILVDGEYIDPENAIDYAGVDAISDYIEDATDDIIFRYISEYELATDILDIEELAMDLIESGESFERIANDYFDLDV